MKTTEHWTYRLSRAYLIGLGFGGIIISASVLHPVLQVCTLVAVGVFAYWRLSNKVPEIQ